MKYNKKSTKQKGAGTGTSGNFNTLVDDIFAFVESTVDTIVNTTELIVDVFELPGDIGKAYDEPAAQLLKV